MVLLVFNPPRPGKVSPHNALDRKRLGLFYEHRPVFEISPMRLAGGRIIVHDGGDQVIGNDVFGLTEPELRNMRENFPLERDPLLHDDIVRR